MPATVPKKKSERPDSDVIQEYDSVTVEEYYAILASQNGEVKNGESKKTPFFKRLFGKNGEDEVDSAHVKSSASKGLREVLATCMIIIARYNLLTSIRNT